MRPTPPLRAWIGTAALAALPLLHASALAQQQAVRPSLSPPPMRLSPSDLQEASIESVTVQARVVGRTATTRLEIVLGNPWVRRSGTTSAATRTSATYSTWTSQAWDSTLPPFDRFWKAT